MTSSRQGANRLAFALAALVSSTLLSGVSVGAETGVEWPSYNNSLASDRYSSLAAINVGNAGRLAVACTFDTGETTAFQSGLVEVHGAILATTEHDTIAIDANTCAQKWRAHEEFTNSYLGAQRGVAVADGRVFRGGRNGHVYAYDEKSGARLWDVTLADMAKGESTPSAPITWQGLVFIGTAGGDNRGVKGRMYALEAASGKIAWEFYLVPKAPGDPERGPQGMGAAPAETWQSPTGIDVTGGGAWTSYSLDVAKGELYVPAGNPAPDFAKDLRKGPNLYAGSVVVLDAKSGAYKRHHSIVPEDFHDYDVSSAPALITTRSGKSLMAVTPKDGFIYAYDRRTGKRLYRIAVTTQFNTSAPMSVAGVRFCPGTQGGSEWNGPAYDRAHDALLAGQVDWCSTVHLDDDAQTRSVAQAQPWTGSSKDGFGKPDPQTMWAGWLTSLDAVSGKQRWQFKAPNPVMGGLTPTAGDVVFFGDMGGNFFALNSDTGAVLGKWDLGGAVAGGVITYDAGAGQRVAVATGLTSPIWPTPKGTAKIAVLAVN
jgi:PQQ-dependent dehydrogenase (methanol/ethanol family)